MTSNEKKVLEKFNEIKQGNTVTMAGKLRTTINYAYDICNKLCERGYIERLLPGRFALYRITPLGEEQVNPAGYQTEVQSIVSEEAEEGEYECLSCGATVKADELECPKCGVFFEDTIEDEEVAERTAEEQSSEEEKRVEGPSPEEATGGSTELSERATGGSTELSERAAEGSTEQSERVAEGSAERSPERAEGRSERAAEKSAEESGPTSAPGPSVGGGSDRESGTEGGDKADEKTDILDHPSVPEDWKTCTWKWR